MDKSLFKSALGRRLTIQIILVSSLITLVLTVGQLYWLYKTEINNVEKELNQLEKVHLSLLSQSLWAASRNQLKLHLDGIVNTPNVIYVAVMEGKKKWAESGRKDAKNIIERNFPLFYQYRNTQQHIGSLNVIVSVDEIYAYIYKQASIILVSNALKTFLVALFMLVFFHKQVNRFIIAISDYIRNIKFESISEPLTLERKKKHKHDEFDVLVDSVNYMQDRTYHAHQDIAKSNERFHAIADYTVDWESWINPEGQLVWVNSSVKRITGYTPEECYSMKDYPYAMLVNSKQQKDLRLQLTQSAQGRTSENIELLLQDKNGKKKWVAMSWQAIYDENKKYMGLRTSVHDISILKDVEYALQYKITELEQAEDIQKRLVQQTQQEKARMLSLLAAMNIGILFEDRENTVIYVNPTFYRVWLISNSIDLRGLKTVDVLEHSGSVLSRPDHFSNYILNVLGTHEVSDSFEIAMADGRVITQISYPVNDHDGGNIGRLWMYEDITRERQTAEQLIYLAERDSLTGLYNRHRFQDEMTRMLVDVDRNGSHGALLFFDLDEFKYINDNFGHRAGDTILIRVSGELSSLVRQNEILSRVGGDEFAVLMPNCDEKEAIHLAERIVRATGQIPFRFEGQNLRLTTSMGIALYPDHGRNSEELIAHADTAMYQAKETGKNGWRIYRSDLDDSKEMLGRLTWNDRISNALENELFELHFQGIYHTSDLQIRHLEALVRMKDESHPSKIIMPGHFIPMAERSGKILDIDRWVIAESIRKLAEVPGLPAIAVNISGRSFDDPELPFYINQQLVHADVKPSRLIVELTETSAVSDMHDAQRFIESLQKTGCQVCLDDFGSGFSSFSYLKHLKVDILKIDGLFIRDLPNDRDNQIFVKSIVDVARGMRKLTVAEFVEDEETLKMLNLFGVDLVQGYHLDMPSADHPALEQSEKI